MGSLKQKGISLDELDAAEMRIQEASPHLFREGCFILKPTVETFLLYVFEVLSVCFAARGLRITRLHQDRDTDLQDLSFVMTCDGHELQAAIKENGHWFAYVRDSCFNAGNIKQYIRARCKQNGLVFGVGLEQPQQPQQPPQQQPLLISSSPSVSAQPINPPPTSSDDALPDEPPPQKKARQEWETVVKGRTAVLYNASTGMYRCPTSNCDYTHDSVQSVIVHFVRHCAPSTSTQTTEAVIRDLQDLAGLEEDVVDED
jgi:hypothetical protein